MAKKDLSKAPNSNLLKTITDSGNANANAKTTIDLDLSLVDENPDNEQIFNMNEIERLSRSIKNEGFAGAIEVYKKSDGRYEISSGHRRVRAVKLLGWKSIPAIVTSMPEDDVVRRTALLSSNINNRDMTPMDYARAIVYHEKTLRLKYGLGDSNRAKKYGQNIDINEELADYFNFKKPSIIKYKSLVKLIPELQALIDERTIPYASLYGATTLSQEDQEKVYKSLMSEITAQSKLKNDDDKTVSIPTYVVERIVEEVRKSLSVPKSTIETKVKNTNDLSNSKNVGIATESETPGISFDNSSLFTNIEPESPVTSNTSADYNAGFDNFLILLDSFSKLDISLIERKRRAALKKKLEEIIKLL